MIPLLRFIVVNREKEFLTPRRSTGVMYQNRSQWSKELKDARIFNSRSAAKNAISNYTKYKEILEVEVIVKWPT